MQNVNTFNQFKNEENKYLLKVKNDSLEEAIIQIFTCDNKWQRDSMLPCNKTVEEVVKQEIIPIANEYVGNRNKLLENGTPCTVETTRELIELKLSGCTDEEAFASLANLYLIQMHLQKGDADTVDHKVLQQEFNELKKHYKNRPMQDAINDLLSNIDSSIGINMVSTYNEILEEVKKKSNGNKQVVTNVTQEFASAELIAIRSAMTYRLICEGKIPNANPEQTPGALTAEIASASDVTIASQLKESGALSSEATDIAFRVISVATIVTIATLLALAFCAFAGISATGLMFLVGGILSGCGPAVSFGALMVLIPIVLGLGCAYLAQKCDNMDIGDLNFQTIYNSLHKLRRKCKKSTKAHRYTEKTKILA